MQGSSEAVYTGLSGRYERLAWGRYRMLSWRAVTRLLSRKPVIFGVVVSLVVLGVVLLFLQPETLLQTNVQKLRDILAVDDVIVVFSPGGWGDASLEQATDFAPVLGGIQRTLQGLGYRSALTVYNRTPTSLSGRVSEIKELLNNFEGVSRVQAQDVEYLVGSFPEKQVIIVGFSNGGALTERVMERIGELDHVCAVVAGVPCEHKTIASENVLVLDNNGRDRLSAGDGFAVAAALIKAPFKWVQAKLAHRPMSFALAIQVQGHDYPWSSPEVGPPIVDFLKSRLAGAAARPPG